MIPRCYTLTHSDITGDLYLTVGPEYDHLQISGWYTRLMRDEALGEWQQDLPAPVDAGQSPGLHVHCHVSGGFVLGSAGLRATIFRRELPLVLEALRYGDRGLYEAWPELDTAVVYVHFHARESRYDLVERWGIVADYR